MQIIEDLARVSALVDTWRKQSLSVAFVPTMGNLHAGHLSLVNEAKRIADKVIVSIFVNPMQFAEGEDFDQYPRTVSDDSNALEKLNVDLLFLPTEASMYPAGVKNSSQVVVPGLSEILCGKSRPGHFAGVTTIVNKLFNVVQPDYAVFGLKDFQQVTIIQKMVDDLFMPIKIVAMETMREDDGLALSSRNQYLSNQDRITASNLYKQIQQSIELVKNGAEIANVEKQCWQNLAEFGFEPEYVSFRDSESLMSLSSIKGNMVLLVAAKLGNTRLIDNSLFSLRN